jgi:DNA invertase Pin-like site-specific DNA recombinase
MLSFLRRGDTVMIYKLDRLARSTKDLIALAERFDSQGVGFISLSDNVDTSTPTGRFFFTIMASIAELEHDIIVERTREGLKAARARGHKGGRKPADPKKIALARKMYEDKSYTIAEICAAVGVGRSTLYKYVGRSAAGDGCNDRADLAMDKCER